MNRHSARRFLSGFACAGVAWAVLGAGIASASPASPAGPHALQIAQTFIQSVERKDLDAVAATLAPDADQIFLHTSRTKTREGADVIVAGNDREAVCVAYLQGKDEILAYSAGLFEKFTPLRWVDADWSVSRDGNRVFFRGRGDMATSRTKQPYRNSYVMIFRIQDSQIVRIDEYGDVLQYAALGIPPNEVEARSMLRALVLLAPVPR